MTPTKLLTANFSERELDVEECSMEVKGAARILCCEILEKVRAKYSMPVFVTNGYRSPEHNKEVGGKEDSWHLYIDGKAACDFKVIGADIVQVFDWMRLESGLKFDKLILEYSHGKPAVIHVQIHINEAARRLAYIGETGDAKKYKPVPVTPVAA